MQAKDVRAVAVVGAGTMGSGIAQVCATAGLEVTIVDVSDAQLRRCLDAIGVSLAKLAQKNRIDEEPEAVVGRIRTTTSFDEVRGADVAIEAVFEEPSLKTDVFRSLDATCRPDVVLASNTSSISITRLAAATKRPERVVGMHFFNPVPLMPLVELVRGLQTSAETLALVRELAERLGKTPVEAKDSPGFISNRILMPLVNEAFFALDEHVGTPEDIDAVLRLGMNHPMGPLALADLIGLDVCLAILEVLHRELGDDKYRPSPALKRYVAAGWLGRKSGRGVYRYD